MTWWSTRLNHTIYFYIVIIDFIFDYDLVKKCFDIGIYKCMYLVRDKMETHVYFCSCLIILH